MGMLNLTSILSMLCVAYLAHTGWQFYQMFTPVLCQPGSNNCLLPEIEPSADGSFPAMQLRVYTSIQKESGHAMRHYHLAHTRDGMSIAESTTDQVNITLPSTTLKNGTLYAHVFLMPAGYVGKDPNNADWLVQQSSIISAYQHPVADTFQLMSDGKEEKKPVKIGKPVAHLRSVLPITISSDAPHFDIQHLSGEIAGLLQTRQHGKGYKYYPIMLIDQLGFRTVDLKEIKPAESTMSLSISYRPSSVGKMRMLVQMSLALENLKKMGFTDKDTDEVKGLFSDTNVYLLAVTVCVSTLHILFDVLSFKNDISFWKSRKTMVGLSTRTLVWRAFSSTIILLYLADKNTSLLVLIPSAIGCVIEYWKCTRALKVSVSLRGISFGASTSAEQETEQHDSQAMRWLACLMVPLCIGGAVYSLLYVPHKSWYSWVMECLANGVYAFGFLFMLPQLFVNYKLKSVAHLPWRAFMYKAFNTFIDDLFAFIITMPTAHRLACFRDDIVFVVYLWQRYLYPVDHTRINEFGEGGEEGESAHKEEGAEKADKKND